MRSLSHVKGWLERKRNRLRLMAQHRFAMEADTYRRSTAAVLPEYAGGDITLHADGRDYL